ncbi:MAG: DUF4352 domain-containing protein [Oscillospiraceae bacterium]|nr:DUF4352 domain-containing protein [Oscillospiraceae bacterium]
MNALKPLRRTFALLMTAAVVCTASVCLSGCSDNSGDNGKVKQAVSYPEDEYVSIYTPEVPDQPIDASVPGSDLEGKIGETIDYDGKVSVTLNKVVEIDDVNKLELRVLLCEMTIKNTSDSKIDCQNITHFRTIIDGNEEFEPVKDVRAGITARKYYSQTGSNLDIFNQEIAPGESVTGYVYLGMPTSWSTLQLAYMPLKYYTNDRVLFTINENELEHYEAMLG